MTKSMVMVFIHGLTADDMMGNGPMANNTEEENIYYLMVRSELVYGKMERESNG